MQQLITPNPNIACKPGWCLQYVRQTYGLPAAYPTATAAWNASTSKHRDRLFPKGMWTPVWFALAREPAGHVALMAPDGSVYSTSDLGNVPHHHLDLSDLMNFYARYDMTLTYLGWTEDVAGYPVMASDLAAQGSISADAIINQLQEAGMALDFDDKVFIQTVVNGANGTAILDNRAQAEHWAKQIIGSIKDSNWDVKTFVQSVDNANADRIIIDNRVEEEKTRVRSETPVANAG